MVHQVGWGIRASEDGNPMHGMVFESTKVHLGSKDKLWVLPRQHATRIVCYFRCDRVRLGLYPLPFEEPMSRGRHGLGVSAAAIPRTSVPARIKHAFGSEVVHNALEH
jgi:hypothetical protein